MSSKFYYFGFGSNMLAKRIRLQNPSAVRIGPGKLEDYRLDFHTFSKNWQGSPATIVPTRGSCVYGAIWEIDCCNMKNLDKQEGVSEGIYVPITVSVLSINCAETIDCRAYHLVNQPTEDLNCMMRAEIPCDRQPSKTYLKTLVKGALETGVAADYIYWLRSIKHNGRLVEKFEKCLELQNVRLEI